MAVPPPPPGLYPGNEYGHDLGVSDSDCLITKWGDIRD